MPLPAPVTSTIGRCYCCGSRHPDRVEAALQVRAVHATEVFSYLVDVRIWQHSMTNTAKLTEQVRLRRRVYVLICPGTENFQETSGRRLQQAHTGGTPAHIKHLCWRSHECYAA